MSLSRLTNSPSHRLPIPSIPDGMAFILACTVVMVKPMRAASLNPLALLPMPPTVRLTFPESTTADYNGLILGVEADYSWSRMGGSVVDGEADRQGVETDYFRTVRGRLGAATDEMMVYITGGYGFTRTTLSVENGTDGLSINSNGFVYGAGLEYAIAPGITLKGEWLRMALDHNLLSSDQLGSAGGALDALMHGDDDDHFSLSGLDIFRLGINFQLGALTANSNSMAVSGYRSAADSVDFSGFYAGVHVGYDNADVGGQFDDSGNPNPPANFALFDMAALNGGIQAGYNFQSGSIVYGLEADYTWTRSGDSFVDGENSRQELSIDRYSTVRGRLGVVSSNLLVFATAGIGWSELDLSVENGTDGLSIGQSGWAYGGGLEWSFTENLSLKAEYLRIEIDEGIEAADNSALDNLSDGDDGDSLSFDGLDLVRVALVARF